jgi:hypothetical protein
LSGSFFCAWEGKAMTLAAMAMAARFLYMVVLYMAPETDKKKRPPGRDLMHELYARPWGNAERHCPTRGFTLRIKKVEACAEMFPKD